MEPLKSYRVRDDVDGYQIGDLDGVIVYLAVDVQRWAREILDVMHKQIGTSESYARWRHASWWKERDDEAVRVIAELERFTDALKEQP